MTIAVEEMINILLVNSRSAVICELNKIRAYAAVIEGELKDKSLVHLTDQERTTLCHQLIKTLFKIFATCDQIKTECRSLNEILCKAFPDKLPADDQLGESPGNNNRIKV